MDDLRFYVLFKSVSVISGRWDVDGERLVQLIVTAFVDLRFTVEKILPRAGIELGLLDQ